MIFYRFNQTGLQEAAQLEDLLVAAAEDHLTPEMFQVTSKYPELDLRELQRELPMLSSFLKQQDVATDYSSFHKILKCLERLPSATQLIIPQITTLVKLIQVFPSTAAESERSFSSLRRIKTYLRSTMTQKRLSEVALCNMHQSYCDRVNISHIAKQFIRNTNSNERKAILDVFKIHTNLLYSIPFILCLAKM